MGGSVFDLQDPGAAWYLAGLQLDRLTFSCRYLFSAQYRCTSFKIMQGDH